MNSATLPVLQIYSFPPLKLELGCAMWQSSPSTKKQHEPLHVPHRQKLVYAVTMIRGTSKGTYAVVCFAKIQTTLLNAHVILQAAYK